MKIYIEDLREDLKQECYGAYFGAGFGVEIERMSPEELGELALQRGVDLAKYEAVE